MVFFLLETGAMLLAAYVVGCLCGCMLRKALSAEDDLPLETAGAGGVDDDILGPEIADADRPGPFRRSGLQTPPAPAVEPVLRAGREPIVPGAPIGDAAKVGSAASISLSAAAAAAAASAIAQGRARDRDPVAPKPASARPASHSDAAGDDLKRIRGIGPEIENALHRIGVKRYAQIAAWTSNDVDDISNTLGFKGRIEHENWIEQAQVLAREGETSFSRRYDRGDIDLQPPVPMTRPVGGGQGIAAAASAAAAAASTMTARERAGSAPAGAGTSRPGEPGGRVQELSAVLRGTVEQAPPSVEPARAARQDLTRIDGIDREIEAALNARGIMRYEQIARWKTDDVADVGTALELRLGRVEEERWIEQARRLAGILDRPASTVAPQGRGLGLPSVAASSTPASRPAPAPAAPTQQASSTQSSSPAARPAPPPAPASGTPQQPAQQPARPAADAPWPVTPQPSRPAPDAGQQQRPVAGPGPGAEPPKQGAPAPAEPAKPPVVPAPAASPVRIGPAVSPPAPAGAPPRPQGVTGFVPGASPAPTTPPASPTQRITPAAPSGSPAGSGGKAETKPAPSLIIPPRAGEPSIPAPPVRSTDFKPLPTLQPDAPRGPSTPIILPGGTPQAAKPTGPQAVTPTAESSAQDDLKRIKGIGATLEKKLNGLGVTRYRQIANWSEADVEKMSSLLDAHGHIERENWIAQARILANGGLTDYARRIDKGELDNG